MEPGSCTGPRRSVRILEPEDDRRLWAFQGLLGVAQGVFRVFWNGLGVLGMPKFGPRENRFF